MSKPNKKEVFGNQNQSFKILLLRVTILVVLVAGQPWLWGYVSTRVSDFQQKRFQTDQIDELNQQIDQINQAQASQSELINQLDLVVPTRNSLAQVIDRLERLATERSIGLKITDINDDATTSTGSLVTVQPVTIITQVTGTPAQVLQYFDAVEHLQSLTVVNEWSLAPNGEGTTQAVGSPVPTPVGGAQAGSTYNLSMSITFFLQPAEAASPAPTAPKNNLP